MKAQPLHWMEFTAFRRGKYGRDSVDRPGQMQGFILRDLTRQKLERIAIQGKRPGCPGHVGTRRWKRGDTLVPQVVSQNWVAFTDCQIVKGDCMRSKALLQANNAARVGVKYVNMAPPAEPVIEPLYERTQASRLYTSFSLNLALEKSIRATTMMMNRTTVPALWY